MKHFYLVGVLDSILCLCFTTLYCLSLAALGNSQTFSNLTNEEVSTIVRADNANELIRLWTASESGSGRPLRAAYLATDLLDEDFFPGVSEWLIRQSKVPSSPSLEDRIKEAFPNALPDDIRSCSKTLKVLALDPSRMLMTRFAATLAITASDKQEFNECMILCALTLRHEFKSNVRSQPDADWNLVIRVLQSSQDTIVFANLLRLWRLLQSKDTTDEEIREAFSALRQGQFIPPFLVEEGNRDQNRLVIVKPRFYQRPDLEHLTKELEIETTDFAVLEEFRAQEIDTTMPRNQRQTMFNEIFGALKVLIRQKGAVIRPVYLVSIADDLALLASRMMQLDSEIEILSAKVHLGDCERCADIDDAIESPIVIPNEIRYSACFGILTPEYYFGKRSTDFYAKCKLAASLAKKWELSILSKTTDHQETIPPTDNDSSPKE